MAITIEQRRMEYERQQKETRDHEAEALRAYAPSIPLPEGWSATWADASWWNNGGKIEVFNYELISPDGAIMIAFRPGGAGTTKFKVGDGWRTFDRIGVDDSFYWLDWGIKAGRKERIEPGAIIEEQLQRIKDRLAFHAIALTVPEIGFKIAPETKARYIEALRKADGHVSFTPSGFGTGYTIARYNHVTANGSNIAGFSRWKRASTALDDFFSVGPLWIERFDCD